MKLKFKKPISIFLALIMIISSIGTPTFASTDLGNRANHIIISQIYGGGGNSGAPFTHDFVELYNPTNEPVDLTGWVLSYASANGLFSTNSSMFVTLKGSIGPGSYYLIELNAGKNSAGLSQPLPVAADAKGEIDLAGANGKVALSNSSALVVEPTDPHVVDFVGYGSANKFETIAAPATSNTTSIIRKVEGVDTNNNGADFITATPNPRNSAYGALVKCATPTADIASGEVDSGTVVNFSSATTTATLEYNTVAADHDVWTAGNAVIITEAKTVYVRAVQEGIQTSDVATFTYTIKVPGEPEPDYTPISTLRDIYSTLGVNGVHTDSFTIKGVVTAVLSSTQNIYIQDATGGTVVRMPSKSEVFEIGQTIVATGVPENFRSLGQLKITTSDQVKIMEIASVTTNPKVITVNEVVEANESLLVQLNNLKVISMQTTASYNVMMEDVDGRQITVRVENGNVPAGIFAVGNYYTVTGVLSQYHTTDPTLGYQLMTRMASDVISNKLILSATPAGTDVVSGATLTLTASDATAVIHYTTNGSDVTAESTKYANGIKLVGNIGDKITVKAIAIAAGQNPSDVFEREYTVKDPNAVMNIKEVLNVVSGTDGVEVRGTIAYFATTFSNPVIHAVIDGKVYSLYVFGSGPSGAKIGDEIKLKGLFQIRNGMPQLNLVNSTNSSSSIIGPGTVVEPQLITVSELKANGLGMLGRVVKIADATLGVFSATSSTPITDATGSINIFRATPFPLQVEAGDVVDVYAMVAAHNTTVQLFTGTKSANGFNIYDITNDTKPPVLTLRDTYPDAKPNQNYTVSVKAEDNKGIQDVKISYTIGALTTSDVLMTYNDVTLDYVVTIPGSEILASETAFSFTVVATDVSGLKTTKMHTVVIDSRPQVLEMQPARNASTGNDKSPVISVTLGNAGENPEVKLTLRKDGLVVLTERAMVAGAAVDVYQYATASLEDGQYSATVVITRADAVTMTLTWNFTVGTAQYRPFFGQLHAHTAEYSDGSGSLADALAYLKNLPTSENVGFIAVTDHSNYFDTTAAPNPAVALNDLSQMTAQSLAKWNNYNGSMKAFNEANVGSLVALPGFEMTWSGGPGHINTFNSVGIISRNNTTLNNKTADGGLKAYYEELIKNPDPLANLSQFNHPGSTFGTFSDFAYWSPAYDNKMVAVEVANGEGAIGSGGYFPSYAEYTKALDKGWHVAPTNNQDNHRGKWGNSNTARTVIIADELSSTGLLTGLKNMSVYSTEDKNLEISYTLNDQIMGSTISEVPVTPLKFVINVDDPDVGDIISKIEVITNSGRIAISETFDSNSVEWIFELPPVQAYYYVRVTQADKNIAVTAPIWVGQAPLVGISSIEAGTKMPVTQEALKVTTTLFNNESNAVTLKSVRYTLGETELLNAVLDTPIATTGTYKHELVYTPTLAGKQKISVVAVLEVDGQERSFTKELELVVRDSEKLVYVGIDASHFNEYVRGNYKDAMGNFASLAVDYDVRIVELETEADLIAATKNDKFKMIVLTTPTRRNGDNFLIGYKNYSDAVISALRAYSESGNTLIVSGWSDVYEKYTTYSNQTAYKLPAEDQMSAQQNKLLAALGATLRISDDEIRDDKENGGSAQRLYFKNYNLDNEFVKNVVPAEQVYSNYGGATIYGVDSAGLPTPTLSSTVSPMVFAFGTSYSSDRDADGTTGIAGVLVPKYNDLYMVAASERVSYDNGNVGTIIVAGAAFMSNFEIKVALDSYATPEYSNYTILETIIQSINPVEITSIAAVHAAPEGQKFTIQGIATANASGYDKDTAFFDSIYVQDATAGINLFPVAGDVRAGQLIQVTGMTSSYNGERQLNVEKLVVLDAAVGALPSAVKITSAQAASGHLLGSLVEVTGTITRLVYANGIIESIFFKDESGVEARVFIDGYITQTKVIENLRVGGKLTAVGLSSIDPDGTRIRIRDRGDVAVRIEEISEFTMSLKGFDSFVLAENSKNLLFRLTAEKAKGINVFEIVVNYDPSVLKFEGAQYLGEAVAINQVTDKNGQIKLIVGLTEVIEVESAIDLFELTFKPLSFNGLQTSISLESAEAVVDGSDKLTPALLANTTVDVLMTSYLLLCDLNNDGVINAIDLSRALKGYRASSTDADWLVKTAYLNGLSKKDLDVNLDGVVDMTDFTLILHYYSNK